MEINQQNSVKPKIIGRKLRSDVIFLSGVRVRKPKTNGLKTRP
jgi:hypothetical protein